MPLARLKHMLVRTLRGAGSRHGEVLPADTDPATLAPGAIVPFRCNLCGTFNRVPFARLAREIRSCAGCGSTVRFRAMAHLLITELLGRPAALPDLPRRKDLAGIGLSDDPCYARPLARKLAYTNTWFHRKPRLDIANAPTEWSGRFDFLLASDVFEHVVPPVATAFAHARRILKPGGVLVCTVPFSLDADTVEHFPELHDFRIVEEHGTWVLHNRTTDGRAQTFDHLVFHGGPGSTLEMRVFSLAGLEHAFAAAGFRRVRIGAEPYMPFGIVWPDPWSVPLVAYA